MEEDAREFLWRIVKSLTAGLLWLMINMTLGIYAGLLIFKGAPTTGNIIFYVWFVGSLGLLLFYLYRVWKTNQLL
jgi:hypothetical protein